MPVIGEISRFRSSVELIVEWRITGFLSLPQKDHESYSSPDFSFGEQTWNLEIYPNGTRGRWQKGKVILRLWKSSGPNIKQTFSISLKTYAGEKYNETHYVRDFSYHRYVELPELISKSELSRRAIEFICHGVLSVVCSMKSTSAGNEKNSENIYMGGSTHLGEENTEKSKNICVEAFTQTGEENGNGLEQNSQNTCVEACTQTEEENDEWFKEKSRNACVEASTQTKEQREELKGISTAELNKADGLDEAEASCFSQTGAAKTKRSVSPINLTEERDWVTDVSDFLKEGRGVDVTFELETPSGKTQIFAHQLILALRSPYFADEFYSKRGNKGHLIISLKGIDPKTFEILIRYCYGYKPCLRTTKDACALFKVAFEFKVMSLQNLCHSFFRHTKIEPENVFSILKVSVELDDKSLGDMCYQILEDKTREVMAVFDLCNITPAMVYTLLKLPTLSLNSEYELIKWLFDWGNVKSEDKDSSSKNAREYLERLLKDMNFLALTMGEFAVLCKDNPEFFSSDEIISIYQNIACPGTKEMPTWYDSNVKCRVYTGSKE